MSQYTKLFNSIVTSTIWAEDDKTRIVWITMLALANKNGEIQGSIPGLARIAAVSVESCRIAIQKFLSPDPDSRTKDDEGRRIEEIDGGWSLLNHQKYREMASKEESREAEAKRKARYRAKIARNNGHEKSQNVRDMSQDVTKTRHIADTDTDTDPFIKKGANAPSARSGTSSDSMQISWNAAVGFTGIESKDIAGWQEAFPAIDIQRQTAAANQWLLANPRKAKKSNYRRFLTSWFSRGQDRGGDVSSLPTKSSNPLAPGSW